jgi:hypothetical protein
MAKARANPDKTAKAEEQLQRFVVMTYEVGADQKPDALDRAFGKIYAKKRPAKPAKSK